MYYLIYLILTLYLCKGEQLTEGIINKNVERTIDLTSQLVKVSTALTLENTGKNAINSFLISLEPETRNNVSHISVKDNSKDELKITPTELVSQKDSLFYVVQLKQPLPSGRTVSLKFEYVLTKALVPYPSSITQKEKQLVRYFGNHYFYSPYLTKKQTTIITLSSKNIESYTKLKPYAQSEAAVTYGPYNDIQPFSINTMIIHYENNSPFLTVTRLERLIEISHWGNIAVEENIEILHTGSKLKGPFSRYDYQRDASQMTNHHSIKSYRTSLPSAAYNIYYRDSNGNISTSTVRPRKDEIELELRPRFPLFGGWRSSYTLGYNVPSYQYLYKASSGEYILSMRLIDHIFDDMHVEELETSIVLPVGVVNVKVITPYEVERLQDGITYKYLDNLGRTVIKLRKTNLIEKHIQDVEVHYQWQSLMLFHEPLLVSLALYVLFIIVVIYVRLDFSIHKPEHVKKE